MSLSDYTTSSFLPPQGDPRSWLARRLLPLEASRETGAGRSDFDLNPDAARIAPPQGYKAAAVLVPLVDRPEGLTVLLTVRSANLSSHAGQIAFPGGRVDPDDRTIIDAALRETEEEIGIGRDYVTPVGRLDPYETVSGFLIFPVVGVVREGFMATANPGEVEEIFEVPLSFLMDYANHQRQSSVFQGVERHYYTLSYGDYNIWGATAGMLINLYSCLNAD